MIRLKRTAFVVFTGLTPFAPAFGKAKAELKSNKGGLGGLTVQARIDPLPENFRLEHFYTPLSNNEENAASSYQFLHDGTFLSVDSSTPDEGSLEMKDAAPAAHGRYRIDGFTLQLLFNDGHVEEKTIVVDQADTSLIWLDGDTFIDQE